MSITYLWSDNSKFSFVVAKNAGTYWVEVSDIYSGCSSSDTINIFYNPSPQVNLGNDTSLCYATSLNLNASASNASYLWSDNSTQSNLTVSTTGNYWVIVSSTNCSDTDSVDVSYNSQIIVNLGNDTSICENTSLILNATTTNATAYLWSDNSGSSLLTVSGAGTYWAKVMVNQCSSTDSVQISEIPLPAVSLGNDTSICNSDSITLNATTTGASYLWLDNSSLSTFTTSQAGTYQVSITTLCGTATDYITIDTIGCECYVYLPNTFSPNEDHLNDRFIPSYDCSFLEYEFSIYDRFGERIFIAIDPTQAWDGKINSTPAEIGIYTWHLYYKGNALPKKIMKSEYGRVSLVR
jgi:gliding motility-associated-like protein